MQTVYFARDGAEGHLVAGLLENVGIDAYVVGEYLQGGIGELAAMNPVEVRVDDEDLPAAQAALREYDPGLVESRVPEADAGGWAALRDHLLLVAMGALVLLAFLQLLLG
ncbi:MAG: DUF2007 domain-containing protein [Oceanococcaceae bacterium]